MYRKLAIVLLVLIATTLGACRTRTKKVEVTPAPTAPTETVAEVAPTPVDNPEDDFVRDTPPPVTTEELSNDPEQLNRTARERGWIQDAYFEYDSAVLNSAAQEALSVSANWLKTHPEIGLLIEGHCDERGTEQYNLALGERRAGAAKDYLQTLGVDSGRIRTISYGEERPFETGTSESSFARNRRAHLVLTRR